MFEPANFIATNDHTVPSLCQAMLLTHDNYHTFAAWCHGTVVQTFDPLDEKAEPQVGVNFQGRHNMERVSEGEMLIKVGEFEFEALTASRFHHDYEVFH